MPRDLSARTRLITTKQRLFAKELTWPSGELLSFGAEGSQRMTAPIISFTECAGSA
jgi:hypothetical protein